MDLGRGHRQRRRRRSSRWPIEKERWRKPTTTRTTKRKSSYFCRGRRLGALPRRMKASGFLRPSRLIETNIDNTDNLCQNEFSLSLFSFLPPLFPSSVTRIPFDDFYRCHFFNDRMFHPWLHLFFRFLRPSVSYRMLYFLLSHRCWKTLIKRKNIIQCTWLKRKPIISVRFFCFSFLLGTCTYFFSLSPPILMHYFYRNSFSNETILWYLMYRLSGVISFLRSISYNKSGSMLFWSVFSSLLILASLVWINR